MELNQSYQVKTKANLLERFAAFLIDYSLILIYSLLVFYYYGEPNEEGGYVVYGFPGFSIILWWFIVTVGMEQLIEATIGNKLNKLKPVQKNNPKEEITFGQSLKRHLLDWLDLSLFGLIAYLTIKNTDYNQRIGDLWAKTIVINTSDEEQGIFKKLPLTTHSQNAGGSANIKKGNFE